MRKLTWLALIVVTAMSVPPSDAFGQGRGQRPGPPPGEPSEEAPPGDDAEIEETIQIYMIARLRKILALSGDQEETVIPLLQDLGDARRKFARERRLGLLRLRPLAEDPAADARAIASELNRFDETERAFRTEEDRLHGKLRAALTPQQQARFLLFQDRFRAEMQQRLRQIRGLHGSPDEPGRGQPRGPGAPRGGPPREIP